MRITTFRGSALPVAFALVALSCSGPTASAPSPSPGARYLAMVAPGNVALDRMVTDSRAQPMDGNKVRADAKVLLDDDVKLSSDLLSLKAQVGAATQAHIEAGRSDLTKEIADLRRIIATTTDADLNTALNTFQADGNTDTADFAQIRHDLGLAPPPTF